MLATNSRDAAAILGPDDVKFRSSMTLFHHADPDDALFRAALEQFFEGECDPLTHQLIGRSDQ